RRERREKRGAACSSHPCPLRSPTRAKTSCVASAANRKRCRTAGAFARKMNRQPRYAVPPGGTVGILGGGQLGRMLALAAARLGLKTHIYSDAADAPGFDVA